MEFKQHISDFPSGMEKHKITLLASHMSRKCKPVYAEHELYALTNIMVSTTNAHAHQ
jgi:hypothetical protein